MKRNKNYFYIHKDTIIIILFFSIIIFFLYHFNKNSNTNFKSYISTPNSFEIPFHKQTEIKKLPINIETSTCNGNYSQIGFITRNSSKEQIFPLFGKQLNASRDKWNYFTSNDSYNSIQLPINVNGKSGFTDYGVDKLENQDNIYVDGINDTFSVTLYDNSKLKYLPNSL